MFVSCLHEAGDILYVLHRPQTEAAWERTVPHVLCRRKVTSRLLSIPSAQTCRIPDTKNQLVISSWTLTLLLPVTCTMHKCCQNMCTRCLMKNSCCLLFVQACMHTIKRTDRTSKEKTLHNNNVVVNCFKTWQDKLMPETFQQWYGNKLPHNKSWRLRGRDVMLGFHLTPIFGTTTMVGPSGWPHFTSAEIPQYWFLLPGLLNTNNELLNWIY